jgi:hypothetical protein
MGSNRANQGFDPRNVHTTVTHGLFNTDEAQRKYCVVYRRTGKRTKCS